MPRPAGSRAHEPISSGEVTHRTMSNPTTHEVEPVAVTGAGVITSIGQDLDTFWAGLVAGVSRIS